MWSVATTERSDNRVQRAGYVFPGRCRKGHAMRKNKEITVFEQEQYDGEWPPTGAVECIAWFNSKIEEIPAEFQSTAKVEIEGVGGYEGSSYASITIRYTRPETDSEMESREREECNKVAQQELREKQQLAALKAKYGG